MHDRFERYAIRAMFVLGLVMVVAGLWRLGDPTLDDPDFGPAPTVHIAP